MTIREELKASRETLSSVLTVLGVPQIEWHFYFTHESTRIFRKHGYNLDGSYAVLANDDPQIPLYRKHGIPFRLRRETGDLH